MGMAYTEIGRLTEVRTTSGVYFHAAYTLLQLGKLKEALERLEQGKTRLLAEALALNNVDLVRLSEIHQSQMHQAKQRVYQLQALMRLPDNEPVQDSDYDFAEALRQARIDLNQLIQIIREDNPDFMRTSLTMTEILALIPTGGALVIPLITSQGSAVFVLPHGIRTIEAKNIMWLDTFTDNEVYSLLNGDNENLGWLNGYFDANKMAGSKSRKVALETWQTIIENSTRKLWDVLMGPIQQRLTHFGLTVAAPVTLILPGVLSLLPLHAAWQNINGTHARRAFLDDYTVSYAPSVYALSVSHRRVQITKRQLATLLAIVNPTADLPYAAVEGKSIATFFNPTNCHILDEDQATWTAILRHSPGKTYFHFAGHGFFNFLVPMESSLQIAGCERLTMAEIMFNLDLGSVRLAVLSACETGQTEFRQSPDEFIGLPASFLQAGASGVISTLWKANDRSTTLLIWRFYWYHLVDRLSPAAALRQAQIWLRDMTLTELEQDIASLQESDPLLYIELEEIRQGLLKKYGNNLAIRPFAHPYFWAAFTFAGV